MYVCTHSTPRAGSIRVLGSFLREGVVALFGDTFHFWGYITMFSKRIMNPNTVEKLATTSPGCADPHLKFKSPQTHRCIISDTTLLCSRTHRHYVTVITTTRPQCLTHFCPLVAYCLLGVAFLLLGVLTEPVGNPASITSSPC